MFNMSFQFNAISIVPSIYSQSFVILFSFAFSSVRVCSTHMGWSAAVHMFRSLSVVLLFSHISFAFPHSYKTVALSFALTQTRAIFSSNFILFSIVQIQIGAIQ